MDTFFAILEKHWAWEALSTSNHAEVNADLNNEEELDIEDPVVEIPAAIAEPFAGIPVVPPEVKPGSTSPMPCSPSLGSDSEKADSECEAAEPLGSQAAAVEGEGKDPATPDLRHALKTGLGSKDGTDHKVKGDMPPPPLPPRAKGGEKAPLPPLPSDLRTASLTPEQIKMVQERVAALQPHASNYETIFSHVFPPICQTMLKTTSSRTGWFSKWFRSKAAA